MPTIAILDDRKGDRDTITLVVRSTLRKMKQDDNWDVVSEAPPSKGRDVIHWLDENDATVLVCDWKLNEGAKRQQVVNYEADLLIKEIRAKRPTFPIFIITGYQDQARTHLKEVENIFSRAEFTQQADDVVPQMIRAGGRRYDEQRELLTRMDSLSRKVAVGGASVKNRLDLKSLQGYFQADLPTIINLDEVLTEFEKTKKKAQALRQKIQNRINRRKNKKEK